MSNILQTYQHYMGAISYAAFMLFVFLLPFPWDFSQPVLIVWLIAWALEFRWLKRPDLRDGVKPLVPLLLIAVLVAWEALSLLWAEDRLSGWHLVSRHLPLLALVVIGLFGVNEEYKPIRIKSALIAGCLIATACYLMVVYWLQRMGKLDKLPGSWYWTMLGSPHLLPLKHRFYYCLPMLLAIGFSADVFEYYRHRFSTLSAALTVGVADMILVAAVFLTGSRTMMLLLPLLAVVMFFQHYRDRYRWAITAGVVALFAAFLFFGFRYQPRMREMRENVSSRLNNTDSQIKEPRTYIWRVIVKHPSDYGLLGMGAGSADAYLLRQYDAEMKTEKYYWELRDKRYGSHNQYLNVWMELGPLALLLLLFLVVGSPFFLCGKVRQDAVILCLLLGMGLLTETAANRMSGIFILCTMLVLVIAEGCRTDSPPPAHR